MARLETTGVDDGLADGDGRPVVVDGRRESCSRSSRRITWPAAAARVLRIVTRRTAAPPPAAPPLRRGEPAGPSGNTTESTCRRQTPLMCQGKAVSGKRATRAVTCVPVRPGRYASSRRSRRPPPRSAGRRARPVGRVGGEADLHRGHAVVACLRVRGNGAECLAEHGAVHRSGGVENDSEGAAWRLLRREVPARARDVRCRRLPPRPASVGPYGFRSGDVLVKAAGEPRIPRHGRVGQCPDLLDQPGRQQVDGAVGGDGSRAPGRGQDTRGLSADGSRDSGEGRVPLECVRRSAPEHERQRPPPHACAPERAGATRCVQGQAVAAPGPAAHRRPCSEKNLAPAPPTTCGVVSA